MDFEKVLERDFYLNNPYMDVKIEEVFTQEDFFYMIIQLEDLKKVTLFNSKKFLKDDLPYIDNSIKDFLLENRVLYKLTVPLFSKDGRTSLIYIEHDRGGGVGGGSIAIMKKQINGSWAHINSVPLWIS